MPAPTASDVMLAIDATAERLPRLRVIVTTQPLGEAWAIDPALSRIWVDGVAQPARVADAILAALDELRVCAGLPVLRRILRLVLPTG